MKKKKKKEVKIEIVLIFLTLFLITLIYYFVSPTFIGYTVLQGYKIDITNSSNFNYNNEEIEIIDSIIKLKANITSANWTTYSQEIFQISKGYYDPDDKTSKVEEQDDNRQEISSDKLVSFIFDADLSNGDIINLYLKDEKTTNIYLCNAYEECTSSNLGSVYFPDQTGYYQITLQNLNYPKKVFNLNSDEKIKLDYVNSSQGNITKFWYNPVEKTSKINAQDNTTLEVDEGNENKIFDIIFNQELQNNDLIQLYLKNEKTTNIYLCPAGQKCTTANLGQIYFPNQEAYYNMTLQNLNYPTKVLSLNSDEEIEIDYIEAIRITETNHSETNITYPITANITTQDIVVENLVYWDLLITEEVLNDQGISYEYSTNSGETWQQIPEDKNLSAVNSKTIRIKAILNSNSTATPSISSLNITYLAEEPQTYYEINNSGTISTIKDGNITVNSSSAKLELNIVATESLSNIQFNISEPQDARLSNMSKVKEIEIVSPDLQNKISSATIKVYYTDEEIKSLNESTLKVYYHNETSQEWQDLESTVNTEENYIQANVQHFSIYGVFGEETPQQGQDSSSSAGGSGGKKEFTRGTQAAQPQQQQEQKQQQQRESAVTETTQQQVIQTQTETPTETKLTLTGNAVRIGKILATGKVNQSLVILGVILIVAYIITKIEESGKKKFLSLK